jgi:hypothetical protein
LAAAQIGFRLAVAIGNEEGLPVGKCGEGLQAQVYSRLLPSVDGRG